jgi:excisionase family DNA binding protein
MMTTQSGESKMQVSVTEAAQLLGVSEKTIRRRVHSGRLQATQVSTRGVYAWLIDIPDDQLEPDSGELQALRDRVAAQDRELDVKNEQIRELNGQIRELHVLLQQAQAALSVPVGRQRPWWRFWQRG